jgi:flavin reductase (DIM6/NTAB) family NADH-FMN oxidoreductase RutF
VTACTAEGIPHGLTINSFASLSLNPALVIVAIDRECSVIKPFEQSGNFAVNILAYDQVNLSIRFSELPEGRFEGVSWSAGISGAPLLEGVLCVIECRTLNVFDAGDHRGFIGEAIAVKMRESAPLVFFQSGYTELR